MSTEWDHSGPPPAFLAHVYQFERDRLARGPLVNGYGYNLPPCWGPGHGVWKKLRAAADARGVDPVRYVRWSLDNLQVGYPPRVPEPNRLLETRRLTLYLTELPKVRPAVESQYQTEKEKARREMTLRQLVYEQPAEKAHIGVTAGGGDLGLSPLFCYVLARSIGTPKMVRVAGRLEGDALFQFARDPDENAAVYGADGHLPDGFAGRAAEFYAGLVRGFAARVGEGVRA